MSSCPSSLTASVTAAAGCQQAYMTDCGKRTLREQGQARLCRVGNRIVVLPDLDLPRRHERAIANVIRFIRDYQPDYVVGIGRSSIPAMSSPSMATLIQNIRGAYDGELTIQAAVVSHATATSAATDRAARQLADLGVRCVQGAHLIADGWVSVSVPRRHKDPYAGATAIAMARRLGMSVLCAGTGSAALIGDTTGPADARRTTWGFEIGSLADPRKQFKGATSAIQLGFGLLTRSGGGFAPTAVPVKRDGSFEFDGTRYG